MATANIPTHLDTFEIKILDHGVCTLAFNRPQKYNALNPEVYRQWGEALQWAAQAEEVKVLVMTGHGKFYSSGHELALPDPSLKEEELKALSIKLGAFTENVVRQLIHFPKLIIAAINGPAIGFAVTSAALCDVVYSVPEATFNTPFMKLGFCAEGCSSVIFPRIMGYSRANEMLLMGRKFTAPEMIECGMVSRTFPKETFLKDVLELATLAAKFPPQAMKDTKGLIRNHDHPVLNEACTRESEMLIRRTFNEDSKLAIQAFLAERQKPKSKI